MIKHQNARSLRFCKWTLFLAASCAALLFFFTAREEVTILVPVAPPDLNDPPHRSMNQATRISATELISRPLATDRLSIPKLFHQSWSSDQLPRKFECWSESCRQQHPDWEWVLWTDEDNLQLVKTHFPWFLDTYLSFPNVINQADVARLMYMYIYGGVYADLDVECLRPLDEMFAMYNVTLANQPASVVQQKHLHTSTDRTAFFGRMGDDPSFAHSIPNAWMASAPGHPFFLFALHSIQKSMHAWLQLAWTAEAKTGPKALIHIINDYRTNRRYRGDKLEKFLAGDSKHMIVYPPQHEVNHTIVVLPPRYIYPYSWNQDGSKYRDSCWLAEPSFDSDRCKQLVGTDHWPSYTITYWSHTWSTANKQHDNQNLGRVLQE